MGCWLPSLHTPIPSHPISSHPTRPARPSPLPVSADEIFLACAAPRYPLPCAALQMSPFPLCCSAALIYLSGCLSALFAFPRPSGSRKPSVVSCRIERGPCTHEPHDPCPVLVRCLPGLVTHSDTSRRYLSPLASSMPFGNLSIRTTRLDDTPPSQPSPPQRLFCIAHSTLLNTIGNASLLCPPRPIHASCERSRHASAPV